MELDLPDVQTTAGVTTTDSPSTTSAESLDVDTTTSAQSLDVDTTTPSQVQRRRFGQGKSRGKGGIML